VTDYDLGNARGYVEIDPSGVKQGMDEARRHWDAGLSSMLTGVENLGRSMQTIGAQMTAIAAPFAAGMGVAIKGALDFDESMTNVGAVLGKTRDEMTLLTAEVLAIGEASRAGPQAAANAFYDIVGGVADASTHMAILNASIATAEAGNAELGGVTKALISVMNSYAFEAKQAAFASDVLTRTVGVGVGTMDELASALPLVSGLANSTGVSFDQLGAMMSLLSTKGNTFSQSATQIRAIMVAMLNPNAKMKQAFEEIGVASGQAAIEQYGLAGALALLNEKSPTFQANMAGTLGSIEALNGSIALTSEGATEFLGNFSNGLEGATDAARELQNASPAAAMDKLMSKFAALRIELGTALVPVLIRTVDAFVPILERVTEWVKVNPKLVAAVGAMVGGMVSAGPVIAGVGTALTMLVSPVGAVIAAIGALGTAWHKNLWGIRDTTTQVFDAIGHVVGIFRTDLKNLGLGEAFAGIFGKGSTIEGMESTLEGALTAMGMSRDTAIKIVDSLWAAIQRVREGFAWLMDTLRPLFDEIGTLIGNIDFGQLFNIARDVLAFTNPIGIATKVLGAFGVDFKKVFEDIVGAATRFLAAINGGGGLFDGLRAAFGDSSFLDGFESGFNAVVDFVTNTVLPALESLYNWFVSEALPAIVSFVETTVLPAIQGFFDFLAQVWEITRPGLETLYNWFVNEALPAISNFITQTVVPAVQAFIGTLQSIWDVVAPHLLNIYNWFVTEALPAILNFITTTVIPGVQWFIDTLKNIWLAVEPIIVGLVDWFLTNGWPVIQGIIDIAVGIVNGFIDTLKNIWITVEPFVTSLLNWFQTSGWPVIESILNTGKGIIQGVIDVFVSIWNTVKQPLEDLKKGVGDIFNWIGQNIIQPVIDLIKSIVTEVDKAVSAILGLNNMDGEKVGSAISDRVMNPIGGSKYGGGGFASGGFTGYGPADAVAGFVHANEYVIPAQGVPVLRERSGREDEGGMTFQAGAVVIHANSYEQGRAAADGFEQRLEQLRRSRG